MVNEFSGSNDEREKVLLDMIEELLDLRCDLIIDIITDQLEEIRDKFDKTIRQSFQPELTGMKFDKFTTVQICLTPSESFVLDLIFQGRTNKEIDADIHLIEGEFKNIIIGLLKKLKAADETQHAVNAVMQSVVKFEEMPSDGKKS